MPSSTDSTRCVVAIWAWVVAVGLGFFLLGTYHHRPSRAGAPAVDWPSGAPVALDASRPTLLMFLHPRCPCSRASVAELASILGGRGDRVAAHAVVFRPAKSSRDWDDTPGAAGCDAAAIPGLRLVADPGGETSRRFGVETSGHVLLYDPAGRLLYAGGITPSRGHRGDNPGLAAVLARLDGADDGAASTRGPVFGCPTTNPATDEPTEAAR